jgi:hypothetical protein
VEQADLIFVMAGRPERKVYGLELYRAGIAPRLVLSVGRFEVSRMGVLGLDHMDELVALRDRTPPHERHFFTTITPSGVRIEKVPLKRWSTYGEVVGLQAWLQNERPGRLLIVSTNVHLRRVALCVARVFRGAPFEIRYAAVPPRRPHDRRFLLSEFAKLVGYRIILAMPDRLSRKLMRAT